MNSSFRWFLQPQPQIVLNHWGNVMYINSVCIPLVGHTLLDLQSMVVSLVVSCRLSGTCTGPGGFETEIWEWLYYYHQTLWGWGPVIFLDDRMWFWHIYTWDPWWRWRHRCGSEGCSSLGGMAATLGFSRPVGWVLGCLAAVLGISVVLAGWMILKISCLGAAGAGACLVGTCGPGIAASLMWIQFLLKTPLGVLTTYELGVSAIWITSPAMDNSWMKGPAALPTALVGAGVAPWYEHHTCWSPAWIVMMPRLPHCWVEATMICFIVCSTFNDHNLPD